MGLKNGISFEDISKQLEFDHEFAFFVCRRQAKNANILSNIFFTPFVSSSISTGANITPTTEESDSVLGWAKGGIAGEARIPCR